MQDFIPLKSIRNGIVETTDGRYLKILEIEPINFLLRSSEEQYEIISSFASWLKIAPMRLQFKSITRKADSDQYIAGLQSDLETETSEACCELARSAIRFIREEGSREALTRRFFLIFQYEAASGHYQMNVDYSEIYAALQTAAQNARTYFSQCGNNIVQPKDEDAFLAELIYMFFNRRSCVDDPFLDRLDRIVVDAMLAKKRTIGVDPLPNIRDVNFVAPRGIDLTHSNYVIMDGSYYTYLYIRKGGYQTPHASFPALTMRAGTSPQCASMPRLEGSPMSPRSEFQRSLEQADARLKRTAQLLARTRRLADSGNIPEAFNMAFTFAAEAEKLTLLARSIPAYTGHPQAALLSEELMVETVPVDMGYTEQGWFLLRLPALLPKKESGSPSYLRDMLYPAMRRFFAGKLPHIYSDCVLIFRHIYDRNRPERSYRDHDNIELNMVVDIVALYLLPDDAPLRCAHYYCSAGGDTDRTEIYAVPCDSLPDWLSDAKSGALEGVTLYGTYPQ